MALRASRAANNVSPARRGPLGVVDAAVVPSPLLRYALLYARASFLLRPMLSADDVRCGMLADPSSLQDSRSRPC
jgi:hypothetical protein